ncbi:MAG: VPLPA-CTERM sorting domain-containing protein [Pseudomonadota bacterium]
MLSAALGLSAGLTAVLPAPADAATILTIEADDGTELLRPGATEGLALVFELFQDTSDVSIRIDTLCLTICETEIFLSKRNVFDGIGPASAIEIVDPAGGGALALFDGLSLPKGIYSLVVRGTSGFFGWQGTTSPTAANTPTGAVVAVGAVESLIPGYAPSSTWVPFSAFTPSIRISGTVPQVVQPSQVPLPAAGWLLVASIGGLAVIRRRAPKRATH